MKNGDIEVGDRGGPGDALSTTDGTPEPDTVSCCLRALRSSSWMLCSNMWYMADTSSHFLSRTLSATISCEMPTRPTM